MEDRAVRPHFVDSCLQIEGAHGDALRHADTVRSVRGDPKTKVRWKNPETLSRGYLHHTAAGIDQLIRTVRMERNVGPARIFLRMSRNGDPSAWVVLGHKRMTHNHYFMPYQAIYDTLESNDDTDIGSRRCEMGNFPERNQEQMLLLT